MGGSDFAWSVYALSKPPLPSPYTHTQTKERVLSLLAACPLLRAMAVLREEAEARVSETPSSCHSERCLCHLSLLYRSGQVAMRCAVRCV
jgi:hypothetical protein